MLQWRTLPPGNVNSMASNVLTVRQGIGQSFEVPSSNDGPLLVTIESVPSGAPGVPVDVDASPPVVGVSGASATSDHKHHLAVGSPVAVALANADGIAVTAARSDHVHALTAAVASQVYAANWAVTDWYIDGTTGNDANNGTSALTPLRTGAELLRRLGAYALWGQSVTVHVLVNGMVDALILRGAMLVAGTHLDVVGTPTILATDTVATYTAMSHATPVAAQITATTIADWTPYQWRRVRITSGVRAGAIWWVATSNPAGAGVSVSRVTRPCTIDPTNVGDLYTNVVPVALDPIAVESLPSVPSISILLDGPVLTTAGAQYAKRQVQVSDVSVASLMVQAPSITERSKAVLFGLRNQNQNLNGPPATGLSIAQLRSCSFFSSDPVVGGFVRSVGQMLNCLYGEGMTSFSLIDPTYIQDGLFQGAAVSSVTNLQFLNCQIFDVAGASNSAFNCIVGTSNGMSGNGNAGFGIGLTNVTNWRFLGTTNLQGTVSNGRLLQAPATNLTLPQLLQPSDYAQKGITPAMVAGATTVTVPWYDNATQRVTVSHAVFAGTPGVLSVQQISTTQFTITSASALDTSTVNWSISPLGRNIFVSTT